MSNIYEKYFDKKFSNVIQQDKKNINALLSDDMSIICGDFYGIQKFIFENLSTTNASKVLRAKSAFIQIFTQYLAEYICCKINVKKENIISSNAGKFEIIVPKCDNAILDDIQNRVDQYFLQNFYGLSGISISQVTFNKGDFKDKRKYRLLRDKITDTIEEKKFKKLNLQNLNFTVLDYDTSIDNKSLCKICNIRKITGENCSICDNFIQLGKQLVKRDISQISNKDIGILIDNFETFINIDKKIKSYVLKGDYDTPASFEALAKNSCKDLDSGIKSLAILKADVDSMGQFIRNSDITDNFENFDAFSKSMDSFFSLYVPSIMREKYRNTYTIFAGGDDLFLVGAWDEVLALAREIHKDFRKFTKNKLSISYGIAIAKPSTPISHLAEHTEELLEYSKEIDEEKNAITIFGETVKWDSYLKNFKKMGEAFEILEKNEVKTAFLYRLLDLVEMGKKVKYEDSIEDTIWKSKLNYSFYRNMDKKYDPLLKVLNEEIENNPKETKMFLNEYVYKRRES